MAHFDFNAHGKSTAGANQGPVYTHHEGTISPLSYCNIHKLWEYAREVELS